LVENSQPVVTLYFDLVDNFLLVVNPDFDWAVDYWETD